MNAPLHPSNSAAQTRAETAILRALNDKLGLTLAPQRVEVGNRFVQLDGYDAATGTLCEINARQGTLKSAQKDKVASDILKMLLVEKVLKKPMKKIICFASTEAAASFGNKSWLALCAKEFDIVIETVEVSKQIVNEIEQAQKLQFR